MFTMKPKPAVLCGISAFLIAVPLYAVQAFPTSQNSAKGSSVIVLVADDGSSSVCDQGGGRMGPCAGTGVGLKADQGSVCDQGGGRMGPCPGSGVGLKADQGSVCDQGGGRMGPCPGSGVGLKTEGSATTSDKK